MAAPKNRMPRFLRRVEGLRGRRQSPLYLSRALRLVWESGPGWTVTSALLMILQGILPLAALYVMKQIVDGVAAAVIASDKALAMRHLLLLVGAACLIAVLTIVFDAVASFVGEAQVMVVSDHIHDILHAKAITVDLEYYEKEDYYNTLHLALQQAPARPASIVRNLVQIGQNVVSLVGVAGLLLSLHWGIAVVLFAAMLPGVFVRIRYAHDLHRWHKKETVTERRAHFLHLTLTHPVFAKEVKQFDLGQVFRSRFKTIRQLLRQERVGLARRRAVRDLGTQMVAVLPVFASYALVAYETVLGTISLGGLVMYYGALQRGYSFLQSLTRAFSGLYEDGLFLSSVYEFLDLRQTVTDPAAPRPFPEVMQAGIVFAHVAFQYSGSSRWAIEDVSLTIRPGEIVALVGENGSGKTTLTKLLCRLYDPARGRITIDGVDLRQMATSDLRRRISVVFQDYVQYHLSARENIWVGDAKLPLDDEKIVAAAQLSGADEVIRDLERGYDTALGKWIENGEELSVGEWQKIALARAFLRDAPVIILDEPTSSLDARAEYEVFDRFRRLIQGRTAILISHRLSSVRMADRIYFVENGRIVENGTHEELMRRQGRYARLFEMQAENYR